VVAAADAVADVVDSADAVGGTAGEFDVAGAAGSLLRDVASRAATIVSLVVAAVFVSPAVAASVPAGAASGTGGLSATGAGVSTGLAISAGGVSSGGKAVTWSLVMGPVIASAGAAGAAESFGGSAGFAVTGSTRNAASIGSVVSGRCANATSGGACQDEVLAKDSWAARNSAAAPSPKMRSDIDNMVAAKRKRKPGSMARGILRKLGRTGTRWPLESDFANCP
jgi:hypothetical protein